MQILPVEWKTLDQYSYWYYWNNNTSVFSMIFVFFQ